MRVNRRWVTTGSVFFLALATGHLMQNADRLQAYFGGSDRKAAADPVIETGQATAQGHVDPASVVQLSADTTAEGAPASLATTPVLMAADPQPSVPRAYRGESLSDRIARLQATGTVLPPAEMSCAAASLSISPAPGGMLKIAVSAPCDRNAALAVRHDVMELSYRTDERGNLDVMIPALRTPAAVEVAFPGRDPVIATVAVPDVPGLNRIALLAGGAAPVDLVVGQSSADPYTTLRLGDPSVPGARLAQVYSFPAGLADPLVRVEALVTAEDCGRWLHGQTVHVAGGEAAVRDFSLAMPGCDAVGDLVVLPVPAEPGTPRLADATP